MATGSIDYAALAKQYGATGSTAATPVDYDALAKQYGATSSTAPKPQATTPPSSYVFADKWNPQTQQWEPTQPLTKEDQQQIVQSQPPAERFARSFNKAITGAEDPASFWENLKGQAHSMAQNVLQHPENLLNPVDPTGTAQQMMAAMYQGMKQTWERAQQEITKGNITSKEGLLNYVNGFIHAAESGVPGVGPMLSDADKELAAGNIAGAAGTVTGAAAPFVAGGIGEAAGEGTGQVVNQPMPAGTAPMTVGQSGAPTVISSGGTSQLPATVVRGAGKVVGGVAPGILRKPIEAGFNYLADKLAPEASVPTVSIPPDAWSNSAFARQGAVEGTPTGAVTPVQAPADPWAAELARQRASRPQGTFSPQARTTGPVPGTPTEQVGSATATRTVPIGSAVAGEVQPSIAASPDEVARGVGYRDAAQARKRMGDALWNKVYDSISNEPGKTVVKEAPAPKVNTAKPVAAMQGGESIGGNYGKEVQVKTPTGSMPATYKLVEADSLVPSHNAETFAKNPQYPEGVQERQYQTSKEAQNRVIQQAQNYDPAYTVNTNPDAVNGPPIVTKDGIVLGGNSRAMATQRLYSRNGGESYREAIKSQAEQFGLSPEAVDGFSKPILVREVPTPATVEDARRIGSELNKSMTGALGVSEKAVTAGKSIKPETIQSIAGMIEDAGSDASIRDVLRERGKDILNMLVKDGAITERERPQFVDTALGGLSEEGKTFVERALRGHIVDDPVLMDATPKSIIGKLDGSLADITSFANRADEYNILPLLREALAEHADMAQRGTDLETHLAQSAMFGPGRNPAVDAIVRKLAEKPSAVKAAFNQYAKDANYDKQGQGMLLLGEQPSAVKAFNEAFGTKFSEDQYHNLLEESLGAEHHLAGELNVSIQPSANRNTNAGISRGPVKAAGVVGSSSGAEAPSAAAPASTPSDVIDSAIPPTGKTKGLNQRTKAEVDFYVQRGNVQAAKQAIQKGAESAKTMQPGSAADRLDDQAILQENREDLEKQYAAGRLEEGRQQAAGNSMYHTKVAGEKSRGEQFAVRFSRYPLPSASMEANKMLGYDPNARPQPYKVEPQEAEFEPWGNLPADADLTAILQKSIEKAKAAKVKRPQAQK
jgi:hypothetical protein